MNLYLDIDGVLLGKADPASPRVVLANHARRFLEFALGHFDLFWLTTHCKGDAQPVLDYLKPFVPDDLLPPLTQVKPTTFDVTKTEALVGDFFWIDDSPMACELSWLKERGLLDRWIAVDTRKRPDDLLTAMERLKQALVSAATSAPRASSSLPGTLSPGQNRWTCRGSGSERPRTSSRPGEGR